MNRIILLILLLVGFCEAFARDYYVGGSGASDSNPGTATQPFATIQKAASVAVAGDVINIRSGTYRETIVPANSGTIYQPDQGANVIISGLNEAGNSGWAVHSGNIYKKTITLPVNGYNRNITNNTTLAANQVFKDGAMQFEARWPKVNSVNDLLDKSKLRSRVSTSNWQGNTLTDNGLPNIPGGWAGGKIYIIGWFLAHTTNITSHSGTTIGFNSGLGGDLRFLQYYYVTGKLGALTQAKEWHYESGTLYFWQEGGGPPTGVEYKARNWGFDLRGKSNVTVRGLQFFGCDPINGDINSANTVVDGIKAKYLNHVVISEGSPLQYFNANQTGIKLIGPNSTIRNSELQYAGANAIHLGANGRAENNLIQDINYEGNYGAGVIPYGTTGGQIIKGNTMRRMGRACIDMGGIKNGSHLNMNIELNDLYDYGMISADGGAIYGSVFTRLNGTVIHHNWIHDCRAVITPYAPHDVGINAAIYQDQTSGPTTIHHNVFWNNYQTDFTNQPAGEGQNAGPTLLYNNTFATTGQPDHPWARSYVTFNTVTLDVQRNNIYRDDVFFNWILSFSAGNFANCLTNTQNPSFVGSGGGGLNYRLNGNSMAINAGMPLAGITDGSVGAPDIGAYEYGAPAWVPGYIPQTAIIIPNTPPVVSITAPTNNASFTQGFPITISATASDVNGSVTKVEFFSGTTKLGEDLTSPYGFIWSNASVGAHAVTAKATDNSNNVTTSTQVNITVNGNVVPTVSITSPSNNAQFITGTPITITAAAADANGTVTKVEFFNGTTKLGEDLTAPYSFAWNNAPAGTHVLTAKATDNGNNIATSAAVTIVVSANAVPTVSITSPANNAQFTAGAPITINATASDPNGAVTKVEFFSGATKLGEDATSPYSLAWNNAATGVHILTAKVTDSGNSVVTSASVSITVLANVAPTVSITGPANNAQFTIGAAIPITATASDAGGSITKVEFFRGATKLGEDLTSPYSFAWNNASLGAHVLTAKATDNLNNSTISAPVNITVVSVNVAPIVLITSPANNAQFTIGASIPITATASDAGGSITKVEFFRGTTKLGEDLSSPYSFAWNNATLGAHVLTAKATDNLNNSATSAPVNITVVSVNVGPIISITSPANNAQFTTGDPITITATASDVNGTLSKVEFFSGTTKLGEDLTLPYSFIWADAPAGNYSITAKATDNQNTSTSSAAINISVIDSANPIANAGQDISLTLPDNSVKLTAAEAPDGLPLQFNWVQLEGPSSPIFNPAAREIELTDLVEGTYVFELTVTDSDGLISKDQVIVTVNSSSISLGTIPRSFSPNGDGQEDRWEWPNNELYENSLLMVFNHSGQKVYEAVSYNNTWDGTVEGQPLQAGQYQYVIRLKDSRVIKASLRIIY